MQTATATAIRGSTAFAVEPQARVIGPSSRACEATQSGFARARSFSTRFIRRRPRAPPLNTAAPGSAASSRASNPDPLRRIEANRLELSRIGLSIGRGVRGSVGPLSRRLVTLRITLIGPRRGARLPPLRRGGQANGIEVDVGRAADQIP